MQKQFIHQSVHENMRVYAEKLSKDKRTLEILMIIMLIIVIGMGIGFFIYAKKHRKGGAMRPSHHVPLSQPFPASSLGGWAPYAAM